VIDGEGIVVANVSTFAAAITNAGTIMGDFGADNVTAFGTDSAGGGIVNTGSLSAAGVALNLNAIATFAGGITNAGGTISGGDTGIKLIRVTTFSGGITNTGAISGGATLIGIFVEKGASFSGAIVNSAGGTITAGLAGVDVGSFAMFGSSSAGGGITNSGTITATGLAVTAAGINVSTVTTFAGNISNAGTIAGVNGIVIGAFAGVTFAAGSGIVNTGTITGTAVGIGLSAFESDVSVFDSGTISGGTDAVQFGGTGNTFTLGPGYAITGDVVGSGSDTFQLGGTGSGSFDLDNIGTQYTGFGTFNVLSATWTVTGTFAPAASWTVEGGTLAEDGTLSDGVTVDDTGTLSIVAGSDLGGAITLEAGSTLLFGSSFTYGGAITIAGDPDVDVAAGQTATISSAIADGAQSGVLNKTGGGTLVLTAGENYSGGTMIDAGTLELGSGGSVVGDVTFAGAAATLRLDTGANQIGGSIAGAVTGDGIDLGFLAFASGDHAVWQQNGATGTLTVETAGGTTLAALTLAGTYQTAGFSVTEDNQNDVLISLVTPGPVVSTGNPSVTFAAGGSPVTLDSTLAITDRESSTLTSATVAITGGAFIGDVLSVDTTGTAIGASYNSATETLTLSGTDTLADYESVLQQVTFASGSANPADSGADPTRTISWSVNDGTASSAAVTTALSVTGNLAPPANPPPPAGTSADLIMDRGSDGTYEFYDIGHNTILLDGALGQIGSEWQVAGIGGFNAPDTSDMILRNSNTGVLEIYDISGNTITNAASIGQVGLEWSVAGFGDFSSRAGETDMLMRQNNSGAFELYDISNGSITSAVSMGQVGLEWSVAGFGDFSTRPDETDMLMRNNNTGVFELYDISNNTITWAGPMGQVGLEWSVAGFGDFSGNANETDMLMRNNNTGVFELYDISNNTITWAGPMGQVGLEWSVAGIAADPPGGASASSAQLAQAMASFAPPSAAFDTSTPLSVAITQPSSATILAVQLPHANLT
jgi:autotransporter-associated beta strand protein